MRIATSRRHGAFSRSDLVIVVVATSLLLVFSILDSLNKDKGRSKRTRCTASLRQIGLAFNLWMQDNDLNYYPMIVPESLGGSKEAFDNGRMVETFLAMSNQLRTPSLVTCQDDKKRKPTASFQTLTTLNISYFLATHRNETVPNQLLAGDRDVVVNKAQLPPGMFRVTDPRSISWAGLIHGKDAGNVGLIDGSAHQVTGKGLRDLLQYSGSATNTRLLIP